MQNKRFVENMAKTHNILSKLLITTSLNVYLTKLFKHTFVIDFMI